MVDTTVKVKNKRLHLYLPPELIKQAKLKAVEANMNLSEFVAEAIRSYTPMTRPFEQMNPEDIVKLVEQRTEWNIKILEDLKKRQK